MTSKCSRVVLRALTATSSGAVLGGGEIATKPSLRACTVGSLPSFDSATFGGSKIPLIENSPLSERGGSTFGGGDMVSNPRSTLPLMEKSSSFERVETTFGGDEIGWNFSRRACDAYSESART